MKRCGAGQMEHRGLAILAATLLVMAMVSSAMAGIIQPRLSVVGGTGVPGGTVSVTLGLADDVANAGVSAGVDLLFESEKLEFFPPVSASCNVDPRLATTHGIGGRILSPGVLNLEIFVLGTPDPLPPLGNGNLASCDFRIQDDAPLGTSPVLIESPFLGDDAGMEIPVVVENGAVQIVMALPTDTPTITVTPELTSTVTPTPQVTPTATDSPSTPAATVTATPTNTSGTQTPIATSTATRTVTEPTEGSTPTVTDTPDATPTRTSNTPTRTGTAGPRNDDDGCNVVPPGSSNFGGSLALLLGPALLIWVRRRA